MRYLIIALLFVVFKSVGAQEFLPKGCHAVPIGDEIQLTAQKNQLFFIHSLSRYEIWLANSSQRRLTTSIVPSLWSVFYAPKLNSKWRCIQSEPGHEQKVSCHQVLALCEWPAKTLDKKLNHHNAWLAYNMHFSELSAYLQRQGWQFNAKSKSE